MARDLKEGQSEVFFPTRWRIVCATETDIGGAIPEMDFHRGELDRLIEVNVIDETGDDKLAETLGAVETLINDLCQQYGTPGNELGLYVPQQILMKLLVGSDSIYYRGYIFIYIDLVIRIFIWIIFYIYT